MSDTLRDQLLGLGFKPVPRPDKPARADARKPAGAPDRAASPGSVRAHQAGKRTPPAGQRNAGKPGRGHRAGPARSQEDIDLGKAYVIRAQREKQERIEAERIKQEQARERREAKARFAEFVKGKALNDPDADIARHFDYGGKIKRIHVNAAQLKALNAGELGVAQLDGRYLLLAAAVLAEAGAIFPAAIALKVDPDASPGDDPYADPQYQVPDDLVW